MNSNNSRNNYVSILSDEASALLRREEKYYSDLFDEDEKAPNASSILTPPIAVIGKGCRVLCALLLLLLISPAISTKNRGGKFAIGCTE
jgi:hypothetical protein